MADEICVEVTDVSHSFGKTRALDHVSIRIPRGTTVGLVGADGVGKSTLMSLMAGTRIIQSGKVEVFGLDMSKRSTRDALSHKVAFMPQGLGRNLYKTLSVMENINFHASLFGIPRKERKARIERLLQATALDPFADRPAGKLSGGMKQKLSLCCALVHSPDFLILDEPTTGVDPLSRRQFWELLRSLMKETPGMTVLVSTAYIDEAENFENVVVMDDGKIICHENTREFIKRENCSNLEDAYMKALPPGKRGKEGGFHIPPYEDVPGEEPVIEAQHLTKRFGSFTAVNDVSFRIRKGEIFGFLGSNGCGKSTTMKMLTGLLDPTSGYARVLGQPINAEDLAVRMKIGYMSQAFSLYEELTVRENLELHARLYNLPKDQRKDIIQKSLERFGLTGCADEKPSALPLGVKQRLQLAAACQHGPQILILDEPTSGVDPAARDMFWDYLITLSREERVTIFVTTHFMNEAARCDRISLMHRGRVLAVGAPEELRLSKKAPTLEEAFIGYLEEEIAREGGNSSPEQGGSKTAGEKEQTETEKRPAAASEGSREHRPGLFYNISIILSFAYREAMELIRDPIRMSFAIFGALILELTVAYGISFDMTPVGFAVIDHDNSKESRELIQEFEGNHYLYRDNVPNGSSAVEMIRRDGVKLVIDIPQRYGEKLVRNELPQVNFLIDGAFPMMADNVKSYIQGIMTSYETNLSAKGVKVKSPFEVRFSYNENFESVYVMVPGIIMMALMMLPCIMTALGVVREKELGTITNLYTCPATVFQFLLGKQLPYIALAFASFLTMILTAVIVLGVPVTGSLAALSYGALLTVMASTAFGLLVSSFVKSQIAALLGAAVITILPTINFSGFLYPISTLSAGGKIMGLAFPSAWFNLISLGTFTKGLGFESFSRMYLYLFGFFLCYLLLATLFLRKQEK